MGTYEYDNEVFGVRCAARAVRSIDEFKRSIHRSDSDKPVTAQVAFLHKLLFTYDLDSRPVACECGVIDLHSLGAKANIIADEVIRSGGSKWAQLAAGCNVGLLAIPGNYQFEFNDDAMIGVAQVYLELFDTDKLPVHAHRELYF